MVTSNHSDKAFTTEAPTPCSPPDTLYPPPPNLPPACKMVNTTSTAGRPALWLIPTGIPRPLSITVIDLPMLHLQNYLQFRKLNDVIPYLTYYQCTYRDVF